MNKKALITITLLILTAATVVSAQIVEPTEISQCKLSNDLSSLTKVSCPSGVGQPCRFDSTTYDCVVCCTLDTIYNVTNWVFYIVVSAAIILVVIGAYQIMTAGGNPDNVNTGRRYIMWSMVGLGVALLAKSFPEIAKAILRIS